MLLRHEPEARSHNLRVPSHPAESARALSRNATTDQTSSLCGTSFDVCRPELGSHTRTALSVDPERIRNPSGVIATHRATDPFSVALRSPFSRSQVLTVPSS